MKARALPSPTFLAHHLPDPLQFLRHLLVGGNNGIESIGNLPRQSGPGTRKAHGKVAIPHSLEAGQNHTKIARSRLSKKDRIPVVLALLSFLGCTVGYGTSRRLIIFLHSLLQDRVGSGVLTSRS